MLLYERLEYVDESIGTFVGIAAAVALAMHGKKKIDLAIEEEKKLSDIKKKKMLEVLSKQDKKPIDLKAKVHPHMRGFVNELAYVNVTNDTKVREYSKTRKIVEYEINSKDDEFFNKGKAKVICSLDDDGDLLFMNNKLYIYREWSKVEETKMANVISEFWLQFYNAYVSMGLIDKKGK